MNVDDLLAVPWCWGGRDPRPAGGLDCWGLVIEVRRRMGRTTPDPFAAVDREEAVELSEAVLAAFAASWVEVPAHEAVAGDVAVFRAYGGHQTHAGVVLPDGLFLHAGRRLGVNRIPFARVRRYVVALYRDREAPCPPR